MSETAVSRASRAASQLRESWKPQPRVRADTDEETQQKFQAPLRDTQEQEAPAVPASLVEVSLLSLWQQAVGTRAKPIRTPQLSRLRHLLASLFVGDGVSGPREVRMKLCDDVLPGVTLSIFEEGGAWVADFVCCNDSSRRLLCEEGALMVQEMADILGRQARWRVMTDDGEDLRLAHFWAEPRALRNQR